MELKEIISRTTRFLKDKGSASARLDTELLISKALNWSRLQLYLKYDHQLSDSELELCRDLVRRRAQGEPIAYILGEKDFYKATFKVRPGVLIPRPETEYLVEAVIDWYKQGQPARGTRSGGETVVVYDPVVHSDGDEPVPSEEGEETPAPSGPPNSSASECTSHSLHIVDLGTGTGCIGLSILMEIPGAELLALDLSSVAIEVARENAQSVGVAERVRFIQKDARLLTSADMDPRWLGSVDAVVANPPYISEKDPDIEDEVRKFEPAEALFSDEEGLADIRTWAVSASHVLRPGGLFLCEIGAGQGPHAQKLVEQTGRFRVVETLKDLSGRDRYIRAIRTQET